MKKLSRWQLWNLPYWNEINAFSLIELLVVITIILMVGGLISVSYSFMNRIMTRQELNQLALLTKKMQQDARIKAKAVSMNIYQQEHSYEYDGEIYLLPKQVKFGLLSNIRGSPGQSHKLITDPVTFVQKKVTLYPSGAVEGGTIYLTDDKKSKQYALTLAVSPHAFSRKYVFHAEKWQLLE